MKKLGKKKVRYKIMMLTALAASTWATKDILAAIKHFFK
jgi:hypothetical protein